MSKVFPWESPEDYCRMLEFEYLILTVRAIINLSCQSFGLEPKQSFYLDTDDYGDQRIHVAILNKSAIEPDFFSSIQTHLDIVRGGWKVIFFDGEAEEVNGAAKIFCELTSQSPTVNLTWQILDSD